MRAKYRRLEEMSADALCCVDVRLACSRVQDIFVTLVGRPRSATVRCSHCRHEYRTWVYAVAGQQGYHWVSTDEIWIEEG